MKKADSTWANLGSLFGFSKAERQEALDMLYEGGLKIYNDMAWQYDAYTHGSIDYLNGLYEQGHISSGLLNSWKLFDTGIKDSIPDFVGSEGLVDYEQNVVLQSVLDKDRALWKKITAVDVPGTDTADIRVKGIDSEAFESYMKKNGFDPDYGNPVQRWKWLKEEVIPAYIYNSWSN